MQLKGFKISCDECEEIIEVFVELEEVSYYEREMGCEYQYEGNADYICPKCQNDISINIEAWEYPKGDLSEEPEIKISGATKLTETNFNFGE